MLYLSNKTLNKMALFVEAPITTLLLLAVYPRGDDWMSAHHLNKFDGVIGIITAIGSWVVCMEILLIFNERSTLPNMGGMGALIDKILGNLNGMPMA